MKNLQEQISRMKSMMGLLIEEKLPSSASELIRELPDKLKELFFKQWRAKQNPKWHPEGNSLKHIIVVVKRAYHHYPDDPNMIMAALFHDLGKMDTYAINPKTGEPTAYGHEDKSETYVEEFRDWIESFDGVDVDEIKYLVKNHMKVKPSTWDQMKDKKKEPIQTHSAFDKLMGFTDKLDGGGTHMDKEEIHRIHEMMGVINENNQNKPSEEEFIQAIKDVKTIVPLISHRIIHEEGLEHNEENIVRLNKMILKKVKEGDDEILDEMWELAGSMVMKNAINIITFYTK